jgi:hypothetical protein
VTRETVSRYQPVSEEMLHASTRDAYTKVKSQESGWVLRDVAMRKRGTMRWADGPMKRWVN